MPAHDWRRVSAGTFHDFHGSWITHPKEAMNGGLPPDGYYALAEQHLGGNIADVLTLSIGPWPSPPIAPTARSKPTSTTSPWATRSPRCPSFSTRIITSTSPSEPPMRPHIAACRPTIGTSLKAAATRNQHNQTISIFSLLD